MKREPFAKHVAHMHARADVDEYLVMQQPQPAGNGSEAGAPKPNINTFLKVCVGGGARLVGRAGVACPANTNNDTLQEAVYTFLPINLPSVLSACHFPLHGAG